MTWTRIPVDIPSEDDRRRVAAILADSGLATRIVKVKVKNKFERYVEFAEREESET